MASLVFGGRVVFGVLESPHNCRLGIEEVVRLENVSQSFVYFGERQVSVAVDIHSIPELDPLRLLFFRCWQFLVDFCPVDLLCHISLVILIKNY